MHGAGRRPSTQSVRLRHALATQALPQRGHDLLAACIVRDEANLAARLLARRRAFLVTRHEHVKALVAQFVRELLSPIR